MALVRGRFKFLFSATKGAGAVAQTVFARFLIAGVNVCTGIISARVLGSNGRGEMSAMLVWPALLAYVLTLGLPAAIRYLIRREPERRKEIFTIAVIGAGLASLVAIAVGVTFVPVWLHAYPPDVIRGAQIMMVFSPEVMLGLITTAMLETLGEFHTANQTRYAIVLLTLAGLIVLALAHVLNPFSGALAYTGAPVVVALWIAWYLREHFDLRVLNVQRTVRDLASYGFRAYGIDLLSAISAQIDQVMVIAFLSASDVGIYVVALSASRVINILHSAVVSVVFPSAAGLETDQVVDMVGRSARVSTVVALAFAGALALALPILIPLFYGAAFDRGVVVAQILTLEAVLSGLVSVLIQAFMALGKPGIVTILQAIGLAAVLPLMVLLLPHFGLVGAALALVGSTLLRLALVVGAYPAILKARIPAFLPEREDFARLRGALSSR